MKRSNDAWVVGDIAYIDVSTRKLPEAIALVDATDLDLVFADLSSHSRWHAFVPRSRTVYVGRFVGSSHGRNGNEQRFLQLHRTAEAAARAYDTAAREAFGEYAFLNFPEETDA